MMAKGRKLFQIIIEHILILVIIGNVVVSTISNYKLYSFELKSTSTLLTVTLFIIFIKTNDVSTKLLFDISRLKQLLYVLTALLVIPFISLSYSLNVQFGLLKLFSLIVSTIPAILTVYFFILTLDQNRIKHIKNILVVVALVFSLLIIIFEPFQTYPYETISIFSWSHVITGRLMGVLFLVILIVLLNRKINFVMVSLYLIIVTAFLMTNLRASILGAVISAIVLLVYYIISKNIAVGKVITLLLITLAGLSIYYYAFSKPTQFRRLESLTNFTQNDGNVDGGIISRKIAYKNAWDCFIDNPLLGSGFGGFYTDDVGGEVKDIKYPHNMILEAACELGIPGLILIILIVYLVLQSTYKTSFDLFILFCFTLWLAIFSKDIPSQAMFLIGLAFVGMDKKRKIKEKGEIIKDKRAKTKDN